MTPRTFARIVFLPIAWLLLIPALASFPLIFIFAALEFGDSWSRVGRQMVGFYVFLATAGFVDVWNNDWF